jgi:hypothetical protein
MSRQVQNGDAGQANWTGKMVANEKNERDLRKQHYG